MSVKSFLTDECPSFLRPLLEKIKNSPIGYRLAKGVFWSILGVATSRGLMLIAMILVARILGKTEYGELGILQSTIGMIGVFAGFGLGLTTTKHVAEFRQCEPQRAGRIIGLTSLFSILTGGVFSLGLLVCAPWISNNVINAPHLAGLLRIGALFLFINVLNGAQTGALSGFESFKTIAYVNFLVGLISFPILIGCVFIGGLRGAVWGLIFNVGINWLLNHLALRKEADSYKVPFTFKGCRKEIAILWNFSLPAALSGFMVGPVEWLCSALLVNQPRGYNEMGIFTAANQWFLLILFLPNLISSVILPVISQQLSIKNTNQSIETLILAIKASTVIILPLVLFGCIASPYIMNFYGESFRSGWPTLVIVLLTGGLVAVQLAIGVIVAASGKMWIGFAMNCGWAAIFLISTLMFLDLGALGLALARALAYVVHASWTIVFAIWFVKKGIWK